MKFNVYRQETLTRYRYTGRQARPIEMTGADMAEFDKLQKLGIDLDMATVQKMASMAMDSNDVGLSPSPLDTLGSPTQTTPAQFLQAWLPGAVRMMTAVRVGDEIAGVNTVGSWEDQQIVQRVLELTGTTQPYSDVGNLPVANWNQNFAVRDIIRFFIGINVAALEEARAAKVQTSSAGEKRAAAQAALDITRNRVFFYGFNDGLSRVYGFLNDPNLPGYHNVPNGQSGFPQWAKKDYLEITADIRDALTGLQLQTVGNVNPRKTPITMAIGLGANQYLTVQGVNSGLMSAQTVEQWLQANYPNVRIVVAPELDDANGGAGVGIFYADTVEDGSTDGLQTLIQVVPSRYHVLGMAKTFNGWHEGSSNATAGCMFKRPPAVRRISGIS